MTAPRYKTRDWRGTPLHVCNACPFSTFDVGQMRRHARQAHPLPSEGAAPKHPLDGVDFASDSAAEAAIKAGLDAHAFERITPTGKTGGFTVADVKAAARITNPKE